MTATTVNIYVKHEFVDKFIEATIENHDNSIKEPSNLRFDFIRSVEDPDRFMLFEVYSAAEGAISHKETAHYKKWKAAVAEMMAKPREGVKYEIIKPEDSLQWKTISKTQ